MKEKLLQLVIDTPLSELQENILVDVLRNKLENLITDNENLTKKTKQLEQESKKVNAKIETVERLLEEERELVKRFKEVNKRLEKELFSPLSFKDKKLEYVTEVDWRDGCRCIQLLEKKNATTARRIGEVIKIKCNY